ncbi:uncharacterized protein DUF490 [Nonlabens dokdonensis]|uniref:DUF490 domain containing protein n=2 Tax=Nonlabens dokdonensis TaxID=328515 RepID=L7W8R5_NONDD|nr:translocation/assembly module TamB domain-containing protein [Nonlabens dokdonensis]AGC78100.1 DUF490 domain containing protein [Nonlabens dokdonensis DSW-6]PZX37162.1 uncharacterized protein DUF490 [Nonlabens dokdonensis]
MSDKNEELKPKKRKFRWLRRILRVLLGILIFLILLLLFIRSPWGQNIIVDYLVSYVEDKTGTEVQLDRVFITFDGNVQVEGLYLEDQSQDTLVYSRSLEANIGLMPLINGTGIEINEVDWNGLTARVKRADTINGFNYQFLMEAFATAPDTTTTSEPMNLQIGDIQLTDFDIIYDDQVEKMDAVAQFKQLSLSMNKIDLNAMVIDVESLTLEDAYIDYEKDLVTAFAKAESDSNPNKDTNLAEAITDDANDSPLPFFKVGQLLLNRVELNYNSEPDGIVINTNLSHLETVIPKADVENNDIEVSYFNLFDSQVELKMATPESASNSNVSEPFVFEWPDMNISLNDLEFRNNMFTYQVNNNKPEKGIFNPEAVALEQIDIKLRDFKLENKTAQVTINEAQANEYSGLQLHQLEGTFKVTDQQMIASNLKAQMNNSAVYGIAQLGYDSLNNFFNIPQDVAVDLNVSDYVFDMSDIYYFQPSLASNEYIEKINQNNFRGNLNASGTTSNLLLNDLKVNWGNNTSLTAKGKLFNITNVDELRFDIASLKANTNRKALLAFVKEEDLGVTIPKEIALNATANGSLNDVTAQANLNTSLGNVSVDGNFSNKNQIKFDTKLKAQEINLAELLAMPELGNLSLAIETKGSGSDINTLDATIDGEIEQFAYNEYPLENIPINGSIDNGKAQIKSKFKDENINIALDANAALDTELTTASAFVDVVGINLQAFGIASRDVRAAGKLGVDYSGNAQKYKVKANIDDGIAVFDQQSYLLGDLDMDAFVNTDSTSVNVRNKMLDLELRSNTDPQNLASALQRHIDRYLTSSTAMDTVQPVKMKIKGKISPAPILRDVILPGLESLDTIQIGVNFDERKRILDSQIEIPYLQYAGSKVDSLIVSSNSDAKNLEFNVGFKNIASGPIQIKRTDLTGVVSNNILNLEFTSYDDEERLMHFASTLSRKRDLNGIENLIFNLSLDDLILNKRPWTIPNDNEIAVGEQSLIFQNFKLTNESQSIELRSDLNNIESEHIGVLFKGFRLQGLLSYLNPDEKLATGAVNGEFIVDDIYGTTGFIADIEVNQLNVLEVPMGTLQLDANSLDGSQYDMDLTIKGDDVDLELKGDYKASQVAANLNLDLSINKIAMKTIAGLSGGFLAEGSGSMNGDFKVTGTTLEPKYNGRINFNQAKVNVAMLDTSFELRDETIIADNTSITMNNIKVYDAQGDVFSVDGEVGTENIFNPTFDLKVKANSFMALNSTAEDNDLYYGKATFDADATIKGDLNLPVVNVNATVKDVTDVTYVLPATELDVVERDGIVQFVNKENPDAILTQTEEESVTLTGFDISATIKVKKDAKITIIIDPATGDQLEIAGKGDLRYRMTPNGRMTLSGRYEVDNGFYKFNLYDIVSRKFELTKGSSVTWSGDPFAPILDVSALYKVETSASALMATQTSGADIDTKNQFNNELPFLVYLNIDGELMQPELDFNIELPDDEKGAAGGQVNARLQQLNTQDQELNKQVFSLLVLNRFFPTSGADGSSGGTATIARDNLNQALSDQLNQYGGKLLGNSGIDLQFGLDSYTDYQGTGTQDRTQLDITASKKLLDDRLIVSVGSEVDIQGSSQDGEEAPAIGNVSLEYLVTENGRWRLKGFRRNQFDNVVDGQLIVSGISIIFNKEFNEFKNLFKDTESPEEKKARREEEEQKRAQKVAEEQKSTDEKKKK